MANISGQLREGSSQYQFYVQDQIDCISFFSIFLSSFFSYHYFLYLPLFVWPNSVSPTYDYYTNNSFRTYPIPPSEIFLQEVNTDSNIQTVGGYTVSVLFFFSLFLFLFLFIYC